MSLHIICSLALTHNFANTKITPALKQKKGRQPINEARTNQPKKREKHTIIILQKRIFRKIITAEK